ncbi:hypothetical protein GRI62_00360 [Erythrobacter arachoides]|uniref:Secreted protein n=1 Tax=Aurantiacibacter arachoides TaxID=1850444 RepID=A0A844ZZ93_9SPHN|nr:hypothetical protein [Aurantiacibacter arachoides]MXO92057.1 hypothetical protein [Aurantiacibacter arachoides]GGD60105.1 hypothetical protein GCM10011411_20330 [Aurantiacibacter arachoides]
MDQNVLIGVIVVIALLVAVGIWMSMRRRATDRLRDKFGDEYDRTLSDAGDRTAAEKALIEREKRVEALEIRSLTAEEHGRFASEWREVKSVFVDSPIEAVLHADRMLATMMKTVGYPMADFDRRFEDLTVNHADVARHYRAGHDIAARHGSGNVSTEDMRQAMKHYEALYDHLGSSADTATSDTSSPFTIPAAPATTTRSAETPAGTDLDRDGHTDTLMPRDDGAGRVETSLQDRDRHSTVGTDDDGIDVLRQDKDGDGNADRFRLKAD